MDLEYEPEEERAEEPDLESRSVADEPPPSRDGGRPLLWIAVVLAVILAGVALWLLPGDEAGPPPEVGAMQPTAASGAGAEEEMELGAELEEPEAEPVEIPPLDRSDEVVRDLVSRLSSHPQLSRWLATDRLIHRFVAAVDNVAEGVDPRTHLPVQAVEGSFETTRGGGAKRIAPESYRRYDPYATLFVSLDPEGTARLYTRLKPRVREAYRDLGYPDRSFDETLVRAIRHLLSTPIPETAPVVVPRVRGWGFEDPRLEALSPAQKVLVRMGPDNAEAVKSHLRRIARALGVPRDRLEG